MGRRRDKVKEMYTARSSASVVVVRGVQSLGSIRLMILVGLALSAVLAGGAGLTGGMGLTEISSAEVCKNEARRVEQGSTYLPDCRAYELVTPAEKGATQALVFGGLTATKAIPAEDGEKVALTSNAFLGSNPGSRETNVVFSRRGSGWEMTSQQPAAGAGEANFRPEVFSPELTQVGVKVYSEPSEAETSPTQTFEVGPSGGPYSEVATTSSKEGGSRQDALDGASSDLSHVVLSSLDQSLLPAAAGNADPGKPNLYDWADGNRRIVDVTDEGKLVSECGAVLGYGPTEFGPDDIHAVWSEGLSSKIFFTSPEFNFDNQTGGPGCTSGEEGGEPPPENPHRLYMRVNGTETVEVSAPQLEGAVPCDPGTGSAIYQGASADGSEVFFTSEGELTPDHAACRPQIGPNHFVPDRELYEYNTLTRKLTRISRGEPGTSPEAGVDNGPEYPVVISEDGSAVYFVAKHKLTENALENPGNDEQVYRYDITTSKLRLVAVHLPPQNGLDETGYVTPNGEFYLFVSEGVVGEPRGEGHNEIYLYDNGDGKVMCVSCGSGVAPAHGNASRDAAVLLAVEVNWTPPFIPMSEDGRYVFFQTTARLVPQDTNNDTDEAVGGQGQDVYEWEADGTGDCVEGNGCTRLITSGTDEHVSWLLGASRDGSNVFFTTFAQLAPQDVDTQPDIYDARINGGFAAPASPVRCSGEACRLIPSAPPVISTPLSATFSGVGNLAPVSEPALVAKSKPLSRAQKLSGALRACKKRPKKGRARCEAQVRKRYGAKAAKSARKGGR